MKTRQCFVSNSSSSSFLIIGTDITYDTELKVGDCARYIGDVDSGEGDLLVIELLSNKMVKLARKYSENFDFIRPLARGEGTVHSMYLPISGAIKVFSGDFTHHEICDAKTMKETLQLGKEEK